jgi:hypothetical protein
MASVAIHVGVKAATVLGKRASTSKVVSKAFGKAFGGKVFMIRVNRFLKTNKKLGYIQKGYLKSLAEGVDVALSAGKGYLAARLIKKGSELISNKKERNETKKEIVELKKGWNRILRLSRNYLTRDKVGKHIGKVIDWTFVPVEWSKYLEFNSVKKN